MEFNRTLFSCLERKSLRGELQRVLDHYFNVRIGVSCREIELTRTGCFEFDRKKRPGGKVSFLCHICFYFMVAGFTYWSLHPVVDKYFFFFNLFIKPSSRIHMFFQMRRCDI